MTASYESTATFVWDYQIKSIDSKKKQSCQLPGRSYQMPMARHGSHSASTSLSGGGHARAWDGGMISFSPLPVVANVSWYDVELMRPQVSGKLPAEVSSSPRQLYWVSRIKEGPQARLALAAAKAEGFHPCPWPGRRGGPWRHEVDYTWNYKS